jgi:hypothetical protein
MERKTEIHGPDNSALAPSSSRPQRPSLWPEVMVILLGAGLRLWLIFLRPLYTDEVFEAKEVVTRPIVDIFVNFRPDFHLLHALAAKLMGLIGWEPALLRWPSLVAGILSIALLYNFSKALLGRKVALCSVLLFSVLPIAVTSSVEIRGYSFMIFFCLLANIALWKALHRKKFRYWLLFSVSVIAAAYTHLFSTLIVIPSLIYSALWVRKHDTMPFSFKEALVRQAVAAFALISLAVLAIVALIGQSKLNMFRLGQINEQGCENDFVGFQLTDPLGIFGGFVEHLRLANFSAERNWLLVLFGLIIAAGIIKVMASPKSRWQGGYLLLLIFSPIIFIMLLQSLPFSDLRVCARYMDFSLSSYLILAAAALVFFSRYLAGFSSLAGHAVVGILIIVLIAPAYNSLQPYAAEGASEEMVKAAHYMLDNIQPDDLVFCVQRDQKETRIIRDRCILTFHFYSRLADSTYSWQAMESHTNWQAMLMPNYRCKARYQFNNEEGYELVQSCSEGAPRGSRIWLIYWQREPSTAIKPLMKEDTQAQFGYTQLVEVSNSASLADNLNEASARILADGVEPSRWQENAYHAANMNLAMGQLKEAERLLKSITEINSTPQEMGFARKAQELMRILPFLEGSPVPRFSSPAVWNEEIRLLGYSFSEPEAAKDNKTAESITLFWQALKPISKDYTFFLQCRDENHVNLAQLDFQTYDGVLPTSRWTPGEVIRESRSWQMASAPAAGKCKVLLGMYDLKTMQRLPLANDASGENALELKR